jgi:type II secretory pathway pseudopilin PulG
MMRTETIKKADGRYGTGDQPNPESGMSLLAILAIMTIFAIGLMAVAPSVVQDVQREKELESIRRGEDVAEAIRQYVEYYQGSKLPDSMDDLLEGLPMGTKKRMILRPSSAVDPLSDDGKWRLVKPESQAFLNFGRRVQIYNNGVLPSSPSQLLDKYALPLVNIINTQSESDLAEAAEEEIEDVTEGVSFIGVASQSRSKSIIAYYGVENHSKWIFTPLFRGSGTAGGFNPKNNSNPKLDAIDR